MLNSIIYGHGLDAGDLAAEGPSELEIVKDLIPYTKKKKAETPPAVDLPGPEELNTSQTQLRTEFADLKRFMASSQGV